MRAVALPAELGPHLAGWQAPLGTRRAGGRGGAGRCRCLPPDPAPPHTGAARRRRLRGSCPGCRGRRRRPEGWGTAVCGLCVCSAAGMYGGVGVVTGGRRGAHACPQCWHPPGGLAVAGLRWRRRARRSAAIQAPPKPEVLGGAEVEADGGALLPGIGHMKAVGALCSGTRQRAHPEAAVGGVTCVEAQRVPPGSTRSPRSCHFVARTNCAPTPKPHMTSNPDPHPPVSNQRMLLADSA